MRRARGKDWKERGEKIDRFALSPKRKEKGRISHYSGPKRGKHEGERRVRGGRRKEKERYLESSWCERGGERESQTSKPRQ